MGFIWFLKVAWSGTLYLALICTFPFYSNVNPFCPFPFYSDVKPFLPVPLLFRCKPFLPVPLLFRCKPFLPVPLLFRCKPFLPVPLLFRCKPFLPRCSSWLLVLSITFTFNFFNFVISCLIVWFAFELSDLVVGCDKITVVPGNIGSVWCFNFKSSANTTSDDLYGVSFVPTCSRMKSDSSLSVVRCNNTYHESCFH